jgi:hypothetical protein
MSRAATCIDVTHDVGLRDHSEESFSGPERDDFSLSLRFPGAAQHEA